MQKILQADKELVQAKVDEFTAGELPDGSEIGEYASQSYRLFKLQQNPLAGGNVDLILTGAYTKGLFAEVVSPSRYRFNSTDEKADLLRVKYSDEIRGLNQQSFRNLENTIYAPLLIQRLKQRIGL